MDKRKLTTKTRTRYEASIYFAHPDPERPNDHGERVAELVGSEDAAELVRRWNHFPALVEALEMTLKYIEHGNVTYFGNEYANEKKQQQEAFAYYRSNKAKEVLKTAKG